MKNNKKGFTLVELLAVIVILGVLLLIAVPSVNNIINNSKKKAFESQVKLALENVDSFVSADQPTMAASAKCYINVSAIKLERGSWTGYTGYITVEKLATPDANGKNYKTTADISNGTYSVTNEDLLNVAVDSTTVAKADKTADLCTWFS